jgi:hypothetical protein
MPKRDRVIAHPEGDIPVEVENLHSWIHRRDAEDAEKARRKTFKRISSPPLRSLRLCGAI